MILELKKSDDYKLFFESWAQCFPESISSDSKYLNNIGKKRQNKKSIQSLFEWKNGSILSKDKQLSLSSKILPKVSLINKLKIEFNFELFQENFCNVSMIWRFFLLHIIDPKSYPIWDQHVYRAIYFINNKEIINAKNHNQKKEKYYFDVYIPYFNKYKAKGVDPRVIDMALWSFGKFLGSPFGKVVLNET